MIINYFSNSIISDDSAAKFLPTAFSRAAFAELYWYKAV